MKRKYLILFSLCGLILCLDQLAKALVNRELRAGQERVVVEPLLSVVHAQNRGFAFGVFQNAPSTMRNIFFIAVPIFALVLIVLIFIKLQDNQMTTSVALTMILGGALGNLVDRLSLGYVVDIFQLHIASLAPFNLADAFIILGVVLMFVGTWTQPKERAIE